MLHRLFSSCLCVVAFISDYKLVFGFVNRFIDTLYIHIVRNYRYHNSTEILHTFQFAVAHALGFIVFTSRVLATDFSQCYCNFTSELKPTLYHLMHFLP
jgi:hypothetical protein